MVRPVRLSPANTLTWSFTPGPECAWLTHEASCLARPAFPLVVVSGEHESLTREVRLGPDTEGAGGAPGRGLPGRGGAGRPRDHRRCAERKDCCEGTSTPQSHQSFPSVSASRTCRPGCSNESAFNRATGSTSPVCGTPDCEGRPWNRVKAAGCPRPTAGIGKADRHTGCGRSGRRAAAGRGERCRRKSGSIRSRAGISRSGALLRGAFAHAGAIRRGTRSRSRLGALSAGGRPGRTSRRTRGSRCRCRRAGRAAGS